MNKGNAYAGKPGARDGLANVAPLPCSCPQCRARRVCGGAGLPRAALPTPLVRPLCAFAGQLSCPPALCARAEMEALKPLTKHTVEWAASTQVEQEEPGLRPDQADDAPSEEGRRLQQPGAAAADSGADPEPLRRRRQQLAELSHALALLCQLLLLPSSRPLHKQLLSGLRPLLEQQQRQLAADEMRREDTFAGIAAARIAELAEAYLAASGCRPGDSSASGAPAEAGSDALLLGSALAALLANPACKPALADCAVPAVAALAQGIRGVLDPPTACGVAATHGASRAAALPTRGQPAATAGHGTAAAAVGGAGPPAGAAEPAEEGQEPPEGTSYITTTTMEALQDCSECGACLLAVSCRQAAASLQLWAACSRALRTPAGRLPGHAAPSLSTAGACSAAGRTCLHAMRRCRSPVSPKPVPAAGCGRRQATEMWAPTFPRLPAAVSAVYFLLSLFGRGMLERRPDAAAAAVRAAGEALLLALQGQSLVREALASAAVALYAAAVLPAAAPAALAACLSQGLMLPGGQEQEQSGGQPQPQLLLPGQAAGPYAAQAASTAEAAAAAGLLDAHLRQQGTSLAAELAKLAPINRVCAVRGAGLGRTSYYCWVSRFGRACAMLDTQGSARQRRPCPPVSGRGRARHEVRAAQTRRAAAPHAGRLPGSCLPALQPANLPPGRLVPLLNDPPCYLAVLAC